MMRYLCEDPNFEGDFIEFSDTWSRGQVRAAWAAVDREQGGSEDKLLAILRPKVISVHLTCIDAPPISEAAELTPERTEDIDTRLYSWLAQVWIRHLGELATLGNALGRTLFAISDITPVTVGAQANLNH